MAREFKNLEYADELTIQKAIEGRTIIKQETLCLLHLKAEKELAKQLKLIY